MSEPTVLYSWSRRKRHIRNLGYPGGATLCGRTGQTREELADSLRMWHGYGPNHLEVALDKADAAPMCRQCERGKELLDAQFRKVGRAQP